MFSVFCQRSTDGHACVYDEDNDNVLGLAEGCAIDDNLFGQLINIYLSTRFNSNLNTKSLVTLAMVLRKQKKRFIVLMIIVNP